MSSKKKETNAKEREKKVKNNKQTCFLIQNKIYRYSLLLNEYFCVFCNLSSLFFLTTYDFQCVSLKNDHSAYNYFSRCDSFRSLSPQMYGAQLVVEAELGRQSLVSAGLWVYSCLQLGNTPCPDLGELPWHISPFFSPCFFLLLCFFSFFFFFALVAYLFSKFFSSLSLSQCWSKMMRTDRKIWIVSQSRFSALVFPSTKLQERRWDRGYIIDSIYNRAQVLRYINKSLNSHLRIWCRVSK